MTPARNIDALADAAIDAVIHEEAVWLRRTIHLHAVAAKVREVPAGVDQAHAVMSRAECQELAGLIADAVSERPRFEWGQWRERTCA